MPDPATILMVVVLGIPRAGDIDSYRVDERTAAQCEQRRAAAKRDMRATHTRGWATCEAPDAMVPVPPMERTRR
jgi:hypothetical protein